MAIAAAPTPPPARGHAAPARGPTRSPLRSRATGRLTARRRLAANAPQADRGGADPHRRHPGHRRRFVATGTASSRRPSRIAFWNSSEAQAGAAPPWPTSALPLSKPDLEQAHLTGAVGLVPTPPPSGCSATSAGWIGRDVHADAAAKLDRPIPAGRDAGPARRGAAARRCRPGGRELCARHEPKRRMCTFRTRPIASHEAMTDDPP
jgi:hypothetical protein